MGLKGSTNHLGTSLICLSVVQFDPRPSLPCGKTQSSGLIHHFSSWLTSIHVAQTDADVCVNKFMNLEPRRTVSVSWCSCDSEIRMTTPRMEAPGVDVIWASLDESDTTAIYIQINILQVCLIPQFGRNEVGKLHMLKFEAQLQIEIKAGTCYRHSTSIHQGDGVKLCIWYMLSNEHFSCWVATLIVCRYYKSVSKTLRVQKNCSSWKPVVHSVSTDTQASLVM